MLVGLYQPLDAPVIGVHVHFYDLWTGVQSACLQDIYLLN